MTKQAALNKEAVLPALGAALPMIGKGLGWLGTNILLPSLGHMAVGAGVEKLMGGGAQAAQSAQPQAPQRPGPANPYLRPNDPRFAAGYKYASLNDAQRLAFEVGVDDFCEEHGYDADDRAAMYTLLAKQADDTDLESPGWARQLGSWFGSGNEGDIASILGNLFLRRGDRALQGIASRGVNMYGDFMGGMQSAAVAEQKMQADKLLRKQMDAAIQSGDMKAYGKLYEDSLKEHEAKERVNRINIRKRKELNRRQQLLDAQDHRDTLIRDGVDPEKATRMAFRGLGAQGRAYATKNPYAGAPVAPAEVMPAPAQASPQPERIQPLSPQGQGIPPPQMPNIGDATVAQAPTPPSAPAPSPAPAPSMPSTPAPAPMPAPRPAPTPKPAPPPKLPAVPGG